MGRKKIEIRPLHDERNRNVTFLKRKAGLMKKAWELSVLCGADVSLVIFSAAGKAFEFSSKELDGELDRYFEYEGVIERRRAPEFAAMAEADEDDDDDEDEAPGRRGSIAKPPGVTKSLKGKESFKARMPSQADLARTIAKKERTRDRDKHRSKDKHRSREVGYARKSTSMRTTVEEGGESSGQGSSGDEEYGHGDKRRRKSRESGSRHRDASIAGLQYAMNMHNRPSSSSSHPAEQGGAPMGRLPATAYNYRAQHPSQLDYSQEYAQPQSYSNSSYGVQTPSYDRNGMINYLTPLGGPQVSQHHSMPTPAPPLSNGTPGGGNLLPGNMQWDSQLLSRYAELQLHQNHQRQQRALLEQQRQQLAELGIPVEDKSLLDQLFGNHPHGTPGESGDMAATSSNTMMADEDMASQSYSSTNHSFDSGNQPFEWPNVSAAPEREGEERDEGLYKQLTALVNASRSENQQAEGEPPKEERWGEEFAPFPSPASASAGDLRAVR